MKGKTIKGNVRTQEPEAKWKKNRGGRKDKDFQGPLSKSPILQPLHKQWGIVKTIMFLSCDYAIQSSPLAGKLGRGSSCRVTIGFSLLTKIIAQEEHEDD